METQQLPTAVLRERRLLWKETATIRTFGWGRVVSADEGDNSLLLVEEDDAGSHILYVYASPQERERDIETVRGFGSGGDNMAGAGVPVGPLRPAPTRADGNARPFPPPREEW